MPQVVGFAAGALGIGALNVGALAGGFALGSGFAATALGSVAVRLIASVALSALARAIAPRPRVSVPGLRTDQTLTGGINPEAFILGRFGTAGALGADLRSHGTAGQTPNAYLTYVVELAGLPGHQLNGFLLNGEPVDILSTSPHADYGKRIGGRFEGRAWIKYYDGTQTAADPMLLAKYPAPHVRPWTAAMVGRGICYAIVTFQYDREVFTQFPAVKFVLGGVPLYDPRKDSTAGGSGSQRWANPATWAATQNPVVMIYNILRGIALGGGIPAADLPYAIWAQAMDACDAQVSDGNGGLEAAHRAGMEILAEDEPYQVIEELLNACNGALAEAGGVWTIRIGGPGLPVMTITDDDLMADAPDDYRPFPPITEVFNGVEGTWTDPDSAWEARDATPRYNPAWEAEDGGRRLVASVSLPAVTRGTHAQRLMAAKIADHRRMRIHQISLPPLAEFLRPLDTILWTSATNGYVNKLFEVLSVTRDLLTGRVRVVLRECDPGDFIPPVVVRPSVPDVTPVRPAAQGVPAWYVEPWVQTASNSGAQRPAGRCTWDANAADDARGIKIAVRKSGDSGDGEVVAVTDVRAGEFIHLGVIPREVYQMRGRLLADRPTFWSGWVEFTAPDARFTEDDLAPELWGSITDIAESAGIRSGTTLPATGNKPNELFFLVPPGKFYRWDATAGAWTDKVFANVADGSLGVAQFAAGIEPVRVIETGSIPTVKSTNTIFHGPSGKLYRWGGALLRKCG